jgi:RNA recognition motif-containing protein
MSNAQQRQIHQNRPITISVSNLPYAVTDRDIWALFGPFGAVTNVAVSTAPVTEMPMSLSSLKKKMATVVMPIYDEAIFAIMALNDKPRMFGDELTTIKVNFKMTDDPIDHLKLDC